MEAHDGCPSFSMEAHDGCPSFCQLLLAAGISRLGAVGSSDSVGARLQPACTPDCSADPCPETYRHGLGLRFPAEARGGHGTGLGILIGRAGCRCRPDKLVARRLAGRPAPIMFPSKRPYFSLRVQRRGCPLNAADANPRGGGRSFQEEKPGKTIASIVLIYDRIQSWRDGAS